MPESLQQATILIGDRGIPVHPWFVNGQGSHTSRFLNKDDERLRKKCHFKIKQGHKRYAWQKSPQFIGKSRETCQEGLYGAMRFFEPTTGSDERRAGIHYPAPVGIVRSGGQNLWQLVCDGLKKIGVSFTESAAA